MGFSKKAPLELTRQLKKISTSVPLIAIPEMGVREVPPPLEPKRRAKKRRPRKPKVFAEKLGSHQMKKRLPKITMPEVGQSVVN